MNKITLTIITLLVAAGLTLSACGSQTASPGLSGTSWTLVSYGNKNNQTPAAPGIQTRLIFGADGQVSGNLGCNDFSGKYEVKNGKLILGTLLSTMMACPEPQMTQEGSAFQVLNGTVSFSVEGNNLVITDSSGALALTLSREV